MKKTVRALWLREGGREKQGLLGLVSVRLLCYNHFHTIYNIGANI